MRMLKVGKDFINLEHVAYTDGEWIVFAGGQGLKLELAQMDCLKAYLERTCEIRLEVPDANPQR